MKKIKFNLLFLIMVLLCAVTLGCSSESEAKEEKRKDKATPAEAFDYVVYEGGVTIYGLLDESLTTICIPEEIEGKAVRDIADRAFKGNDKLTRVVIEGMEYISDFAFVDCSALKEVVLPDGLEILGHGVFEDCSSLTSIKIPDSVTKMGPNTFFNCSSLRSVTLPAGLTTIESGMFAKCYALTNVKIPDGVTDIGSQAFSHCGLESLEIPEGVTIFGTYAIDDDIVLHVEAGSYAEEWAIFNGYTVVTRGGQETAVENNTTEESESSYTSDKESTFDTAALRNAEIGSYVMFGSFEQNNNYEDGQEPIEWLVLDKKYGYLILISKHGLDAQPYNTKWEKTTWEKCTLRSWLNDEFYQTAFSKEEQERILEVTYQNEDDGNDGIDCGEATCDKVSLLSLKEFYEYFELENGVYKPEMRVKPTEYAKAQGGRVYSEAELGLSGTTEYDGNGYWWLRTVVVDNTYAVNVSSFGAGGYSAVFMGENVVRPIICVKP